MNYKESIILCECISGVVKLVWVIISFRCTGIIFGVVEIAVVKTIPAPVDVIII